MSKTEQPSKRRLRKARLEGDSPFSGVLVMGAALAGALAVVPSMLRACWELSSTAVVAAVQFHADPKSLLVDLPSRIATNVLLLTAPLLMLAFGAAVVAGLLQTGGIIAWKRPAADLRRLGPEAALGSAFSGQRWWSVARGSLMGALLAIAILFVLKERASVLAASLGNVQGALAIAGRMAVELGWMTVGFALVFGGLDFVVAHGAWIERHKMSRAELRAEARDTEGDPELRAYRRRVGASPAAGRSGSADDT